MRIRAVLVALAAGLSLITPPRGAAAQGYLVADLGTLGGNYSQGNAINGSGLVTGYSYLTGGASYHAFRSTGSSMTDLGTLGGNYSEARGISGGGRVVGWAYLTGGAYYHACLLTGATRTDLGTLGDANRF